MILGDSLTRVLYLQIPLSGPHSIVGRAVVVQVAKSWIKTVQKTHMPAQIFLKYCPKQLFKTPSLVFTELTILRVQSLFKSKRGQSPHKGTAAIYM